MKCPACVEGGLKSRLDLHRLPMKAMPVDRFYDEDGVLHVHDHTGNKTVYTCSNGHAYEQLYFSPCVHRPCSWNAQEGVLAGERPLGQKD